MESKINNKMVVLARESRGLTQKELAKAINLTQGKLSKIESEIQGVSEEDLIKISEVLNYPLSFFYQKNEIYDLTSFHYRKKTNITKKDLIKSEAFFNITRINIDKLLVSVEIPDNNYPKFDLEKEGSIEYCTEYLRSFWKIPKRRIENLTKIVEDNGIIVLYTDFDLVNIDGFNIISKNNQPIIFINKYIPADRQRLTLAHELGHVIMHNPFLISQNRDIEAEAFEFAASLLMPEKDIRPELVKLNISRLIELKMYWKVSMAAIIRRAKDLSVLTNDQYKYLYIQMSKLGYRTEEPAEFIKEDATLLKEIIDAHINELGYTISDLANLFSLNEEEVNKKYFNIKPVFRILRNNIG